MTIAAISTAPGMGAIAMVRLSGSDAFTIASHHMVLPQPQGSHPAAAFRTFRVGDTFLDELVVTCYHAPHSYTGEDMVEFSCHGSRYIQQTLLQTLIDEGARLAEPGEFTRRAFLNGRLDLSQAEAVADLIDSTSEASHRLAVSQLRGGYAQRLRSLRDQFVELVSLLELELDFSEEEVEFADRHQLVQLLDQVESVCLCLSDSFQRGNAIKQGVPVAIVGRPNVGKSTLLNALVGEERAIVSDTAGTTRDTIEECVTLSGITFRFIDTAGIRNSHDDIEQQGVARSFRAIAQAQVVLFISDSSDFTQVLHELDTLRQQTDMEGKQVMVLLNKSDLHTHAMHLPANPPAIALSAKTGEGIDTLRQQLVSHYPLQSDADILVTNIRHYEALQHVLYSIQQVRQGFCQALPADLIVTDLREALYHLGTITGQVTSDEILGTIFSRFCIGK